VKIVEAWKQFIQSRKAQDCSRRTIETYEERFKLFLEWSGDIVVSALNTVLVTGYMVHLGERENRNNGGKLSTESVIDHALTLGAFTNWLASEDVRLHRSRVKVPKPKKPRRQVKALSREQAVAVMEAFNPAKRPERGYETLFMSDEMWRFFATRNRAILVLFTDSGLRLSELLNVDCSHINWSAKSIRVIGKGDAERDVPFAPLTARLIEPWLVLRKEKFGLSRAEGPLFLDSTGKPLTRAGLRAIFRSLRKIVGFPVKCHALRHTFATQWCAAGGDVATLSKILGHSSLMVTSRYVSLMPSDLQAAHVRFSPVARLLGAK